MAPMRALVSCLACWRAVLLAPPAAALEGRLAIEYTVKIADTPGRRARWCEGLDRFAYLTPTATSD
ncbi:MAG: hypothetical protein ACLGJB_12225 [Blastocatellia bacterium]